MERKDLLRNEAYWISKIQIDLYSEVEKYLKENSLTRTQFADQIGVTKGYLSQILNGDFDHKISKLVKLSMAIGKVPQIKFIELEEVIENEDKKYVTISNVQ